MKTFNIGRNATNDIVLEDKMVSRQHAQLIVSEDGQVIIKDLGSSNGTFVNGNKTSESQLRAGDIVKCGTTFLKWTQFVNEGASSVNKAYAEGLVNDKVNNSDYTSNSNNTYSLSETLKYLIKKIFNVGDLFMTDWDRTPSILFFLVTPLVIILMACLYFYTITEGNFFIQKNFAYQVLLPVVISIFIYGVSQFLTLSLLTIKRQTNWVKNIYASSIFSFLQFTTTLIVVSFFTGIALFEKGTLLQGIINWHNGFVILFLIVLTIVASLTITLVTFIYKFFSTIGVAKGVGIHLTIFTFSINLILQIAITYFFVTVTFKNLLNF